MKKPKEIILELLLDGASEENLKRLGFKDGKWLCLCGTCDSPLSLNPLYRLKGQWNNSPFSIAFYGPKVSLNKYTEEGFRPDEIEVLLENLEKTPRGFTKAYKCKEYSKHKKYSGDCSDKTLKELYKSLRDSNL